MNPTTLPILAMALAPLLQVRLLGIASEPSWHCQHNCFILQQSSSLGLAKVEEGNWCAVDRWGLDFCGVLSRSFYSACHLQVWITLAAWSRPYFQTSSRDYREDLGLKEDPDQ